MRPPHEVFVLIRRHDEYLILHRSPRQGAYWHCVAGGVEEGETYAEAAVRELREETGLDAELVDLGRPYSIHVECFLAEAPVDWEPRLDWEHDDYRWCATDEAVALLYFPEPREVLRNLVAR